MHNVFRTSPPLLKRLRLLSEFVAIAAIVGIAPSLAAQPAFIEGRGTGLGVAARQIDMSAAGLNNGALLTNQLEASQGVRFAGGVYLGTSGNFSAYNPFARYGANALLNGLNTDLAEVVTITFSAPVTAFAFNLFAFQTPRDLLGPGQMESLPELRYETWGGATGLFSSERVQTGLEDPAPAPLWWGFEGELLRSVSIHAPVFNDPQFGRNVRVMAFANLALVDAPVSVVPEPATLALLIPGVVVVALARRRRRMQRV